MSTNRKARVGRMLFAGLMVTASCAQCATTLQAATPPPAANSKDWPTEPLAIEGKALPLDDVLEIMSSRTGKRFRAVQHLRDRYLTVYWNQRRTSEAMLDLQLLWSSREFPAKWRRAKGKQSEFELWQDPRAAREFERLLSLDAARIRRGIDQLIQLARNDADERPEKTGDEQLDFYLRSEVQWKNDGRPMGRLLSTLPPAAIDALSQGNAVSGPWSQWSEPAQRELNTLLLKRFGGNGVGDQLDRAQIGVFLRVDPNNGKWTLGTLYSANGTTVFFGSPFAELGFSQPQHEALQGATTGLDGLAGAQASALQRARLSWTELADAQLAISRTLQRNLTSDYYHRKKAPQLDLRPDVRLEELLRSVADSTRYTCVVMERPDGFLWRNLRSAMDNANEVPATSLRRWRAARLTKGYLDWSELSELSRMNEKQAETIRREFPVEGRARAIQSLLSWRSQLRASEARQSEDSPRGISVMRTNDQARSLLVGADPARSQATLIMNGAPFESLSIRTWTVNTSGTVQHRFHLFSNAAPNNVEVFLEQIRSDPSERE